MLSPLSDSSKALQEPSVEPLSPQNKLSFLDGWLPQAPIPSVQGKPPAPSPELVLPIRKKRGRYLLRRSLTVLNLLQGRWGGGGSLKIQRR